MVTLDEITARVSEIRKCADNGDHPAAHVKEDALYRDFVEYLAGLPAGPLAEMASAVLATQQIGIHHWYE